MEEIELEKTYLAKEIPDDLGDYDSIEISDVYLPKSASHPTLRIRKAGDRFEITKKEPIEGKDSSRQLEQTILLTEGEFNALSAVDGQRFRKIRYRYVFQGKEMDVDVFKDNLEGLVVVDVEFDTIEEMNTFIMPSFCLADVTQEVIIAGGKLAGQIYSNIENDLEEKFGYKKITFEG